MAEVTFLLPFDLTSLPEDAGLPNAVADTTSGVLRFDADADNLFDYVLTLFGGNLGGSGTIEGVLLSGNENAFFVDQQNIYIPSLVVTGAALGSAGKRIDDLFDNHNLKAFFADLLNGDDLVRGSHGRDVLEAGAGNDTVFGGDGADLLAGGFGSDRLAGGAGADGLAGGAGDDTLTGGAGLDVMAGNEGADRFVYNLVSESKPGSGHDVILGFKAAEHDRVDLKGIDANVKVAGNQAFEFIGAAKFTGNAADAAHRGELRIEDLGTNVLVQGDVNGDLKADFVVAVMTDDVLKAGDFIL